MNKPKKPYNKPGIVFENFLTGELTGTPEMIEKIKASRAETLKFCAGTKLVAGQYWEIMNLQTGKNANGCAAVTAEPSDMF